MSSTFLTGANLVFLSSRFDQTRSSKLLSTISSWPEQTNLLEQKGQDEQTKLLLIKTNEEENESATDKVTKDVTNENNEFGINEAADTTTKSERLKRRRKLKYYKMFPNHCYN